MCAQEKTWPCPPPAIPPSQGSWCVPLAQPTLQVPVSDVTSLPLVIMLKSLMLKISRLEVQVEVELGGRAVWQGWRREKSTFLLLWNSLLPPRPAAQLLLQPSTSCPLFMAMLSPACSLLSAHWHIYLGYLKTSAAAPPLWHSLCHKNIY